MADIFADLNDATSASAWQRATADWTGVTIPLQWTADATAQIAYRGHGPWFIPTAFQDCSN